MNNHTVVINADDFGLHPAVNRGIVRAYREGIVTSTSVMACGDAFEDAVQRLRGCPGLGVGIHLTLVEERPVLAPSRIPSLVDAQGRMPRSYYGFTQRWLSRRIRPSEVRCELEAQIQRVREAGIHPTHLDSHQHVHSLPGVWPMVVELARAYQIPYVRLPRFDTIWGINRSMLEPALRCGMNWLAYLRLHHRWPAAVQRVDRVLGLSCSGRITSATLQGLLGRNLSSGVNELLVHPGERDEDLYRRYAHWKRFDWSAELSAVMDPQIKALCHNRGVRLTHFGMA